MGGNIINEIEALVKQYDLFRTELKKIIDAMNHCPASLEEALKEYYYDDLHAMLINEESAYQLILLNEPILHNLHNELIDNARQLSIRIATPGIAFFSKKWFAELNERFVTTFETNNC